MRVVALPEILGSSTQQSLEAAGGEASIAGGFSRLALFG
jgi:Flp pilus assembly secretin CpaC